MQIHKYTMTQIHKYENTSISISANVIMLLSNIPERKQMIPLQIHMYKYATIQIYKYINTQIHKYTNTQIHKYENTCISISANVIMVLSNIPERKQMIPLQIHIIHYFPTEQYCITKPTRAGLNG